MPARKLNITPHSQTIDDTHRYREIQARAAACHEHALPDLIREVARPVDPDGRNPYSASWSIRWAWISDPISRPLLAAVYGHPGDYRGGLGGGDGQS